MVTVRSAAHGPRRGPVTPEAYTSAIAKSSLVNSFHKQGLILRLTFACQRPGGPIAPHSTAARRAIASPRKTIDRARLHVSLLAVSSSGRHTRLPARSCRWCRPIWSRLAWSESATGRRPCHKLRRWPRSGTAHPENPTDRAEIAMRADDRGLEPPGRIADRRGHVMSTRVSIEIQGPPAGRQSTRSRSPRPRSYRHGQQQSSGCLDRHTSITLLRRGNGRAELLRKDRSFPLSSRMRLADHHIARPGRDRVAAGHGPGSVWPSR